MPVATAAHLVTAPPVINRAAARHEKENDPMKRSARKAVRQPMPVIDDLLEASSVEITAFRKLDTEQRLAQLRGSKVERTFVVERDTFDKAARTAYLSIASEEPYERWWGIEVLDMGKQSIRDARLKLGAPLLVGHDTADQVGVVESYEITSDKKLRILARFGRSQRAEEIWQDVLDGIRRNASVGYLIHALILEKQDGDVSTYRVTDWEPLEGSLVPVPADPTVGVGRSHESAVTNSTKQESDMDKEEIARIETATRAKVEAEFKAKADAETARLAAAANTPEQVQAREQARVNDLLAAGDEFKDQGGLEVARELIKDAKATVDTFKLRMFEKQRGQQKQTHTAQPADMQYGDGARHLLLRGQKLRSFTQPLIYSDGSKMEPIECAYRAGQWLLATIGQSSKAAKWCNERGIVVEQRVMTTGVGSAGGYIVPDEMEQSIIDLREAYGLARRLARRRAMASDTKSVPKRTGGITAYFVEEDNAGITASDKSWGNVNLVAKTLAALSLISKNLEEDSIIDVVDDLAQEMAWAFSQKEDQCWLVGDGTSAYGGMQGLITLFEATAYASRIAAVVPHDLFSEIDGTDITNVMGGVADFAGLNPQWVCSKLFDNVVFNRLKAAAGGNTIQTLEGRPRSNYLGYDVNSSEIMPKVTTTLDAKVMALFGDFSQSSSFGDRRGIMVEVLRERYAEKLQVGVLAHERFQIVNHDLGSATAKGPVAALYGDAA
jgi:HK97 family phage major capsid protein